MFLAGDYQVRTWNKLKNVQVTFLIQKKISLKIEKKVYFRVCFGKIMNEYNYPLKLFWIDKWVELQFNWVELQFNKFQWVYCSNSSMMCLKAKKILLPLGIILHNFPLVTSIPPIYLHWIFCNSPVWNIKFDELDFFS